MKLSGVVLDVYIPHILQFKIDFGTFCEVPQTTVVFGIKIDAKSSQNPGFLQNSSKLTKMNENSRAGDSSQKW